jgi:ribosomal protein S8
MKEQIIQIPDTLEIKEIKDGKIILVERKKFTYKDIVEKLFPNNNGIHYYINDAGYICSIKNNNINNNCTNNVTSKKQAEKLLAINKLMNVAKYLNDGWQPDWENMNEIKYTIAYDHENDRIIFNLTSISYNWGIVYFKSEELAKQAIEILGKETIKLALCTNY